MNNYEEDIPAIFFADIFSQRMEQLRIMVADMDVEKYSDAQINLLEDACNLILKSCTIPDQKTFEGQNITSLN